MKVQKTTILVLIFSLITVFSYADKTISGMVTDNKNQAIPGVSVTAKGTSTGTMTDINGKYYLTVNDKVNVLIFRYIGLKTKEIKTENKNVINVVMEPSENQIDEVVVMAVGIKREKKQLGYAVETVNSESRNYRKRKNRRKTHKRRNTNITTNEILPVTHNTESYDFINENTFKDAKQNPLSTFSIDVDNASYSNMRRFLNNNQLPPKDAIRIEEMINYFSYDYRQPEGNTPFSVQFETGKCIWNEDHYLAQIGIQGKRIDKNEIPRSNLVFLIDVSGSMGSRNKLPLVKKSLQLLINELNPEDRIALVVYAGAAGKVLGSTPVRKKEKILEAINNLQSGGSTAGGAGIKLAYKIAERNFIKNGNNRVLLATDGDFNIGVSSNAAMERLIEKKRESGVFLTCMGFGNGNYKDSRMELLSNKGNGNYAYIDNITEAEKFLKTDIWGTLHTIAKDVKIQIEFNPKYIKSYKLIGYENRLMDNEDFNDDTKDAGEIGAGHTVTALYEIIPAESEEEVKTSDELKYQSSRLKDSRDLLTLKLRYKNPKGIKSKLIEKTIDNNTINKQELSPNLEFASVVAAFGLKLRGSDTVENFSYKRIIKLAKKTKGKDNEGYRSELIKLIRIANLLNENS
ncbi:MAG: von Willebrand factor type A domain-containing protein [Bacteroidota bacterium]|nr:von Willebrand factor type A domain-containing protein [Bacteroidota bacterium]